MRLSWGTGIAIAYGTFAACTTAFVAFAMHHPVQLVSEDYYASSLQHDQRRAAIENADRLGPGVLFVHDDGRVGIAIPAALAREARGVLRLYRPSDASADRSVALALDPSGRQQVSLAGLRPGRWRAQLDWSSGGRSYYGELPVHVP